MKNRATSNNSGFAMKEQLRRFQSRAVELEDPGSEDLVVPPPFGESALREFSEGEPGDWSALKGQVMSKILSSLSDDGDALTQLRKKEKTREKELEDAEVQKANRLEELKEKLRRSIRAEFPGASKSKKDELFLWIRDGKEQSVQFGRTVADKNDLDDPYGTLETATLWEKVENKEWWRRKYTREFRRLRHRTRSLEFRLGMVRRLKRYARAGALDVLRESLPESPEGTQGESDSEFDPAKAARKLFDGMERSKGGGNIPKSVKEWAVKSYEHFREQKGLKKMDARNEVHNLAEQEDYEFSRGWLEKRTFDVE